MMDALRLVEYLYCAYKGAKEQKAVSREAGEKQYQNTGDLFIIYTFLTRYLLQALLCGFFQVLTVLSGSK